MNEPQMEVLREARVCFRAWLDQAQKSPDPASQSPIAMKTIAGNLALVESALKEASPALRANMEWKEEIVEYIGTLRELRARLSNFEITLRIRNVQMAQKHSQLSVVRSWADLARQIG